MPEVEPVYSRKFQVDAFETDASSCATPETLCNYMQEIAGQHARQMGVDIKELNRSNQTWVLHRLHVRFDQLPYWQQKVALDTWPAKVDNLRAYRAFVGRNADDHTPILGALSYWMILDVENRRPVPIPDELKNRHLSDRKLPVVIQKGRLNIKLDEAQAHSNEFRVRRTDIDMNKHVNNVAYINWALESLPEDYHHQKVWRPAELDIQYIAETFQRETVVSIAAPLANQQENGEIRWGHEIKNSSNGKLLAVAKSRWVK